MPYSFDVKDASGNLLLSVDSYEFDSEVDFYSEEEDLRKTSNYDEEEDEDEDEEEEDEEDEVDQDSTLNNNDESQKPKNLN